MPIDAEQWRAQTGFSCTSRMLLHPPRCKQPKPKVQASTLSLNEKFSLTVVLVTLRTGDFYAWLIACHTSRLLLSIVRMSCRRLRGVSVLLAQCLVVVPMLLIMCGDVEENPGPLKIQVTSLGPDDLNDVRRELLDVSKKWYDIGLELRLQPGDLENIECQNQDIRICLRKMLLHWLKKVDPPPTWERLACALESRTVGDPRLAEQLRTKYCKTTQAAGRPMGQRLQTVTTKDEGPPSLPYRRVHRFPQPVTRKGVPAGGSVGQRLQAVSTKGRPRSGHAREVLPSQKLPSTTSKQSDIPQPIARKGGREHETLKEDARNSLFVNCQICFETIPDQKMVRMPGCTDKLCTECVKNHFSLIIKEKSAEYFNCPICNEPKIANQKTSLESYFEHFLDMIWKHLDRKVYDLCQQKLKDTVCWCANKNCTAGFINYRGPTIKKIQCPACSMSMCHQCKKPWESKHKNLSCEEFAQWKQDGESEAQKQGLATYLRANGIKCPACHMYYDLDRGGCMRLECIRCPHVFCSGCGQSFEQRHQCKRSKSCAYKGLHAHHPRDCLCYLRDFNVPELQAFLRDNDIKFDTEPPQAQIEAARQKAAQAVGGEEEVEEEGEVNGKVAVELKCRTQLRREGIDGLIDEECGEAIEDGHAGLCFIHYKEYLVTKINQKKLDPITMYDTRQVGLILQKEEMEVPDKEEDEDDEDFRERLIKRVKELLPLAREGAANYAEAVLQYPHISSSLCTWLPDI